jgi:hypothetical protein
MQRQTAVVMLDRPISIDLQAVVDAMRRRYPGVAVEAAGEWDEPDGARGHLLHCDGDPVGILNFAGPVPWEPQTEVWVRAARTWEQAPLVEANHGAHVIVGRYGGAKDPLREARVITGAIGGLLDVVPEGAGVIWCSRVARSAELWKDVSRTIFAPYPDCSIQLWIDLIEQRVGGVVDAATIGLRSFVGREIEWEVGRLGLREVFGNVIRLASYLVEHGDVMEDGAVLDGTECKRFILRHARSRRDDDQPVLRVTREGPAQGH